MKHALVELAYTEYSVVIKQLNTFKHKYTDTWIDVYPVILFYVSISVASPELFKPAYIRVIQTNMQGGTWYQGVISRPDHRYMIDLWSW